MINIKILAVEKYNDTEKYKNIGNGIFQDVKDESYKLVLTCELEEGEDTQYPLEDLLDKYQLYVADFLEEIERPKNIMNLVFEGELKDLEEVSTIIGKRVYNKSIVGENGEESVELVIE